MLAARPRGFPGHGRLRGGGAAGGRRGGARRDLPRAVHAGAAAGPEVDDGLGAAGSGSRLSSSSFAGVSRAVRAVLPVRADLLRVRRAGLEAAWRVAGLVAGSPPAGALSSARARRV